MMSGLCLLQRRQFIRRICGKTAEYLFQRLAGRLHRCNTYIFGKSPLHKLATKPVSIFCVELPTVFAKRLCLLSALERPKFSLRYRLAEANKQGSLRIVLLTAI